MSETYADDAPPVASGGFFILVGTSLIALILIIAVIAYYPGRGKRIASQYTAVAAPAGQTLTTEAKAYNRDQLAHLAAARADLAKLVNTDLDFDAGIRAVQFPARIGTASLVNANEARIKLFRQQEKSTTLRQLQSFDKRDQTANAAVESQAQQVRTALGLPPTGGQLF
jgi:hypothetical protein